VVDVTRRAILAAFCMATAVLRIAIEAERQRFTLWRAFCLQIVAYDRAPYLTLLLAVSPVFGLTKCSRPQA